MSQIRTIDSATTPLRSLPLPGRDGASPADDIRLKASQQAHEQSQTSFDAARSLADQSNATTSPVSVSYTGQAQQSATDTSASSNPPVNNAPGSGINVSDEVLRFLLTANEVDQNEGSSQTLQTYGGPAQGSAGIGSYQDVAAAFPRTQSSLFSLAA